MRQIHGELVEIENSISGGRAKESDALPHVTLLSLEFQLQVNMTQSLILDVGIKTSRCLELAELSFAGGMVQCMSHDHTHPQTSLSCGHPCARNNTCNIALICVACETIHA